MTALVTVTAPGDQLARYATALASESWIDGWPFWLRLIVCLIACPAVIVLTLVVINVVAGYPDED